MLRLGLSRPQPRSQKKPPLDTSRPDDDNNNNKRDMSPPSLEDESQQPPLHRPSYQPLRRPGYGVGFPPSLPSIPLGAYGTEPTLINEPSQAHDIPPTSKSEPLPPLVACSDDLPESEESPLHFPDLHSSFHPQSSLSHSLDKPGQEDEEQDPPAPTASSAGRNSPTSNQHSSAAISSPRSPLQSTNGHIPESTEVSELQDSQPQDDDDVPTPPDSPSEPDAPVEPPPPPAATLTPTYTSPMRRLTEHGVPTFAGASPSRTYVSPSHHASQISPSKLRTPAFPPPRPTRRSPSPKQRVGSDSDSDDFTRGMTPKQAPSKRLMALFTHRSDPELCEEDDSLKPPEKESFSLAPETSGVQPQLEDTFIDPPADPTAPSGGASASPKSSRPLLRRLSSTQIVTPSKRSDADDPPQHTTPPGNRRFRDLPPSRASSAAPSELYSDLPESMGAPPDDGAESFTATQVMKQPMNNSSKLFSSQASPLRPRNATRAVSTIPRSIPESRRLQRRTRTSVSEGQPTEMPQAPPLSPSPALESTYINPTEVPQSTAPASDLATSRPSPENHDHDNPPRQSLSRESTERHSSKERTPPPRSGIHEFSGESLVRPVPIRFSPNKYGGKRKARRVSNDPMDGDISDSSSSAPEDPEDYTYREPPQRQETVSSPPSPAFSSARPSPPTVPKITLRVGDIGPRTSTTSSRGNRGKRKALSPSPDLSGPSSGSAPEDVEDFSYHPLPKGKGKAKAKPLVKPTAKPVSKTAAKGSSRTGRPAKKVKSGSAAPSTSTRAPSVAASDAAMPTPPVSISDGPLRVLALWAKTGEYYAGTVAARNKTGFRIKFADGLTGTVPIDKLRILQLKPGEPVRNGINATEDLQVTAPFDGTGDIIHVIDGNSEPVDIALRNLVVLPSVIEKRFNKRLVDPAVLDARFPVTVGGLSASAPGSTTSLQGKVFLITRGEVRASADGLRRRILQHGGQVEDDWQSLFKIDANGYQIASSLCPFVIQIGPGLLSAKVMAALAAGIPILSSRYIEDIGLGADWRSYLVAAGESKYLFPGEGKTVFASQVVDPMWGEASWSAKRARAIRQPFKGLSTFFVVPQGSHSRNKEIKALVPFCLMALGATVRQGPSIPTNFSTYDLIVVEDRDKGVTLTKAQRSSGKLVNVAWLKNCLPLGKLLPPSVVSTAE